MTVLTTGRLVLRDWTDSPGDPDRIFDICSRTEITRWLAASGLPLTEPARAADQLRSGGTGTPAGTAWRPVFPRRGGIGRGCRHRGLRLPAGVQRARGRMAA